MKMYDRSPSALLCQPVVQSDTLLSLRAIHFGYLTSGKIVQNCSKGDQRITGGGGGGGRNVMVQLIITLFINYYHTILLSPSHCHSHCPIILSHSATTLSYCLTVLQHRYLSNIYATIICHTAAQSHHLTVSPCLTNSPSHYVMSLGHTHCLTVSLSYGLTVLM